MENEKCKMKASLPFCIFHSPFFILHFPDHSQTHHSLPSPDASPSTRAMPRAAPPSPGNLRQSRRSCLVTLLATPTAKTIVLRRAANGLLRTTYRRPQSNNRLRL